MSTDDTRPAAATCRRTEGLGFSPHHRPCLHLLLNYVLPRCISHVASKFKREGQALACGRVQMESQREVLDLGSGSDLRERA